MKIRAVALATILGVSAPAVTDIVLHPQAIAIPQYPSGEFRDDDWTVNVWYENNAMHYSAENVQTGDSISLSGAQVSGSSQRRVYTWRNGQYRYQVAWQPRDPNFIRVQVFAPKGKQILNRLLYQ